MRHEGSGRRVQRRRCFGVGPLLWKKADRSEHFYYSEDIGRAKKLYGTSDLPLYSFSCVRRTPIIGA